MEAFMFRCHPQTAKLVELVQEKLIGEVRMIYASFGFHGGSNLKGRVLNKALGGGAILDLGSYCTSIARLVAGAVDGKPFAEPIEIKAMGQIGKITGVDEWSASLA